MSINKVILGWKLSSISFLFFFLLFFCFENVNKDRMLGRSALATILSTNDTIYSRAGNNLVTSAFSVLFFKYLEKAYCRVSINCSHVLIPLGLL